MVKVVDSKAHILVMYVRSKLQTKRQAKKNYNVIKKKAKYKDIKVKK